MTIQWSLSPLDAFIYSILDFIVNFQMASSDSLRESKNQKNNKITKDDLIKKN
jgi:hypothetical protein